MESEESEEEIEQIPLGETTKRRRGDYYEDGADDLELDDSVSDHSIEEDD